MNLNRLRGRVMGRVQGVGFRAFTKKVARQFKLSGWVKNEVDGSVSFEAQGFLDDLEKFKQAIGKGPVFSRVDGLQLEVRPCLQEEADFSILR